MNKFKLLVVFVLQMTYKIRNHTCIKTRKLYRFSYKTFPTFETTIIAIS